MKLLLKGEMPKMKHLQKIISLEEIFSKFSIERVKLVM